MCRQKKHLAVRKVRALSCAVPLATPAEKAIASEAGDVPEDVYAERSQANGREPGAPGLSF